MQGSARVQVVWTPQKACLMVARPHSMWAPDAQVGGRCCCHRIRWNALQLPAGRTTHLTLPRIAGVSVIVNIAASKARKWGGRALLLHPRDSCVGKCATRAGQC